MKRIFAFHLYLMCVCVSSVYAASNADIDKMTSYATLIGRAIACGVDTTYAMKRVGKWMDRTFPPGSKDQRIYLPIFAGGVKYHAQQQASGNSPDTCSQIKRVFPTVNWP